MCVWGGGDLGVSGLLERWRRERCISLEYAQVFIFMHRAVLLLLLVMLGCCMSYFMYIQYICIEPSVLCKHAATSTTTDEAITGCKEKQTQTYSTVQLSTPPQKLKLSLHPSFFFCFFLLWYTNKLPLLKAAVFTFIVVDQNVCDGSGWVACIDELYSPQLYGYGSRSQLSLTSCPAAADSCSHWLSSDKHIACIPARHQTAAWKSNLITRQENQYFRILHSPRSLFYYRSHSHALHICAFQ